MSRHTAADQFRKKFSEQADPELPEIDELGEEQVTLRRNKDGSVDARSFASKFGELPDTEFDVGNRNPETESTLLRSEKPPSVFDPSATIA